MKQHTPPPGLRIRAAVLAVLFTGAAAQAAPPPPPEPGEVRFLVSDIWALPFGEFDKQGGQAVLKRGALLDWQLALAEALGKKARFIAAPYLRHPLVVAAKGADVQCLTSPDWVQQRDAYDWPEPFYTVDEQVVGSASKPLVRAPADLAGKSVGTVLGYHYPMLNALFAARQAQRMDSPSEEIAYRKLLSGRTDYAIMRSADFAYHKAQHPQAGVLVLSPLVVNHTPVHCAVVKGGAVSLDELRAAQRKVMKKTPFAALLEKYLQQ